MKRFEYSSATGVRRGVFFATHLDTKDDTVGVFNGIDLVGVVRLAEGECLALVDDTISKIDLADFAANIKKK